MPDAIAEFNEMLFLGGYASVFVVGKLRIAEVVNEQVNVIDVNNQFSAGSIDFSLEAFCIEHVALSFEHFIDHVLDIDVHTSTVINAMRDDERVYFYSFALEVTKTSHRFKLKYRNNDAYNSILANVGNIVTKKINAVKELGVPRKLNIKQYGGHQFLDQICVAHLFASMMNQSEIVARNILGQIKKDLHKYLGKTKLKVCSFYFKLFNVLKQLTSYVTFIRNLIRHN